MTSELGLVSGVKPERKGNSREQHAQRREGTKALQVAVHCGGSHELEW